MLISVILDNIKETSPAIGENCCKKMTTNVLKFVSIVQSYT